MPKNIRMLAALVVAILLTVAGCGGGIEAKRQALKAKAEKVYGNYGTVVVRFGPEPEYYNSDSLAQVEVAEILLVCFYRLDESQTFWEHIPIPGSNVEGGCSPYLGIE